jgi:ankyrin repeat protein
MSSPNFWKALTDNDPVMAQDAIDKGDEIDQRHIISAANSGLNKILLILVQHPAFSQAIQDGHSLAILNAAALGGHVSTLQVLLDHGLTLDTRGAKGWTILHLAAHRYMGSDEGRAAVLEILIDHGADVHAADETGCQALHVAGHAGRADTIKALIARGAVVCATDNDGWTALHMASFQGHEKAVNELIALGANVDALLNVEKETPLHLATKNSKESIVIALIEAGARSDLVNSSGKIAEDLAQEEKIRTILVSQRERSMLAGVASESSNSVPTKPRHRKF